MKFLTQISSIIVALLFVYTINFKSFVTASYFINKAEIIEFLCINKDKPVLKCDGKCHLANQFSEVERDMEDAPFSPNATAYNLEINLSLFENKINIKPQISEINKPPCCEYTTALLDGYFSLISPPPKG